MYDVAINEHLWDVESFRIDLVQDQEGLFGLVSHPAVLRFIDVCVSNAISIDDILVFVISLTHIRIYDDRVGETTRFTYRPTHEWYWFPQQQPHEVSMLKCYDSVTDGSVSRWSFHTACIDPTAPEDAPCRKNVVVRSYVFF